MSIFTRTDVSRRAFIERAGLLGVAGAAMPFVMNLAAIGKGGRGHRARLQSVGVHLHVRRQRRCQHAGPL